MFNMLLNMFNMPLNMFNMLLNMLLNSLSLEAEKLRSEFGGRQSSSDLSLEAEQFQVHIWV